MRQDAIAHRFHKAGSRALFDGDVARTAEEGALMAGFEVVQTDGDVVLARDIANDRLVLLGKLKDGKTYLAAT